VTEEARCPECGEPISATATYCMHCYADLPSGPVSDQPGTEEHPSGDRGWGDQDGTRTGTPTGERTVDETARVTQPTGTGSETAAGTPTAPGRADAATDTSDQILDPDGIVDNTLTVVVGIVAGIVVGIVATIAIVATTTSAWAIPVGILVWLGSTAYLSRRRTVQGAIAHGFYSIGVVLLLLPFIAFSPGIEATTIGDRVTIFVTVFLGLAIPAGIAAVLGFIVSRLVPESGSQGGS
jgi:hypothetical protein